jgi:competence protein ComEC
MREPLVAPAIAIAGGVFAARYVAFETRELAAAMAAFCTLGLVAMWQRSRALAVTSSLAGLFFAGALVALAHRPGPAPRLDAGAREVVIVSGCVVHPPAFSEQREQFVLELEPGARAQVSVFLKEGQMGPALRYGQRIELAARVRRARNFGNPGSFDYAGYLARQDIYWTASARSPAEIKVVGDGCGSRFWAAIFALRVAALERLERLYQGKAYETGMLEGTLIGETSKVEKVWTEDFRSTGTYHCLVIAGLHVTVLAGVFLFLLRLCMCPQGPALVLTALAAWLYALISGWQAPAVRSAAGFTLFILCRYFYRQGRLLNVLAATAIGFLVLDPEQMFDASFQLSFLCVAAIGAFVTPLLAASSVPLTWGLAGLGEASRDLRLAPRVAQLRVELRLIAETLSLCARIPARATLFAEAVILRLAFFVFGLVVVSAVVQIALALPMSVYFHRVSLSGLSANVLIVPLMSAVIPAGFAAIFTNGRFPAVVGEWLLRWSRHIVEWHAAREPDWRIPDPPLWVALLLVASLILLALAIRYKWRRYLTCPASLIAALFSFTLLIRHPFPPQIQPGAIELTAIDVGQGDSLLVAFPTGKLMVVDGGGIPTFGRRSRSRLDIGEDVVSPYLWSRSIRRVDTLVLTHAHDDHMQGLSALVRNFHPRELWIGAIQETPEWAALRQIAVSHGVRIVSLAAGRHFDYGGARLDVLSPPADYIAPEKPHNNDSLVMRIGYGAHSFVLEGDAEKRMESEMIPLIEPGRIDVLKVGHHGSKTSTSPAFLDAAHPAFAIISVGLDNSYGHPHPDVIQRLEESHAAIFRTDLWGLVSIRTDGRRFGLDAYRWSSEPRRLYRAF